MEKLLSSLKNIPEYQVLLKALDASESAAVTGIGQINRSHLIAGLRSERAVPMVVIVQDDIAAKRLQSELKSFLGTTAPVLPHRELTLYDAAVASRSWVRLISLLRLMVISTSSVTAMKSLRISRFILMKQESMA